MVQLRELNQQISKLGFRIFGVSPDQPSKLRETIDELKINFALFSDSHMTAARAFRIAYKADEATLKALAAYGVDLEAASGEKHRELPVPAVFLVGTDLVIQFEYINPDYSVRVHPILLLTAARLAWA